MVTETVRCSRCDKWFKREKEEVKKIERTGKVDEYICPECDDEIKKED